MASFAFVAQILLIVLGALLIASAGRHWRRIAGNMRFHVLFRRAVMGAIPLGVGLGWLLGWPALTVSALIVGFGELFETTLDISALESGNRNESPFDHRTSRNAR